LLNNNKSQFIAVYVIINAAYAPFDSTQAAVSSVC
jgi:hypothetical protein